MYCAIYLILKLQHFRAKKLSWKSAIMISKRAYIMLCSSKKDCYECALMARVRSVSRCRTGAR